MKWVDAEVQIKLLTQEVAELTAERKSLYNKLQYYGLLDRQPTRKYYAYVATSPPSGP